jgi:hypothetical protein
VAHLHVSPYPPEPLEGSRLWVPGWPLDSAWSHHLAAQAAQGQAGPETFSSYRDLHQIQLLIGLPEGPSEVLMSEQKRGTYCPETEHLLWARQGQELHTVTHLTSSRVYNPSGQTRN